MQGQRPDDLVIIAAEGVHAIGRDDKLGAALLHGRRIGEGDQFCLVEGTLGRTGARSPTVLSGFLARQGKCQSDKTVDMSRYLPIYSQSIPDRCRG